MRKPNPLWGLSSGNYDDQLFADRAQRASAHVAEDHASDHILDGVLGDPRLDVGVGALQLLFHGIIPFVEFSLYNL